MIDGVELVLRHQPFKMRKLQRDDAFRLQQDLHAGDEIVQVRHLGEHIVAHDQVGLLALRHEAARQLDAEELGDAGNALGDRDLGDIGGRLDAEHRHAERQEMLQQIAVIAGEFDGQAAPRRGRAAWRSSRNRLWRARPSSSNRRRNRHIPEKCAPG